MTITITLTGFNDADDNPGPVEMGSVELPTSSGPEDAQRLINQMVAAALPELHKVLTPGAPGPVEPVTPPDEGETRSRRGAKAKAASE